ncbi:MAG TPA: translation elongation factor 4 [Candidatus Saccharimonadia bacterium]|nr:translation elongation factor 4 [Candidatus Saccharimonadia bacterium]
MISTGKIRNFSIIAHIDHGKTTLTDRLLRATNTVSARLLEERMMDSNPIEKERGITIKLAPVRMMYSLDGVEYELNLIDTPGHVDFGYEVSRSLAACESCLLVVDATQGIQAQTLSNFEKARGLGLKVVPVINKIDLQNADPDQVALDLMDTFGFTEHEILKVSAKTGLGVDELVKQLVLQTPAPSGDAKKPLRVLVFTSKYDAHKGVVAYVRVVDGVLKREQLHLLATGTSFMPTELGVFKPQMEEVKELTAGEVGYIATGLKDVSLVRVGDTVTTARDREIVTALPGYKEPQPIVYMDFYPVDGDDYVLLVDAIGKLTLDDSAIKYQATHSKALGNGLRVGFLGILHAEIVQERLEREFDLDLIATSPSVPYEITMTTGETKIIHNPTELPDPAQIRVYAEPMTTTTIFTPKDYLGAVMKLCEDHRAELKELVDAGTREKLVYEFPLSELIVNFHGELKSISSGFASVEYELSGYRPVDACRMDVLVTHEPVEALSQILLKSQVDGIGRRLVKKLKEVIPKQNFEVSIQAAVGGKIIASETISAYRKDVIAKLYGGDQTRKDKLLKKQKKGKKRMKEFGRVSLPQEAFLAILER